MPCTAQGLSQEMLVWLSNTVNVEAEDSGLLRKQGPCKVQPQALRSRGQRAAREQAWGSLVFCRNTGTGVDGREERGYNDQRLSLTAPYPNPACPHRLNEGHFHQEDNRRQSLEKFPDQPRLREQVGASDTDKHDN